MDIIRLSQEMLLAVKKESPVDAFLDNYRAVSINDLSALADDAAKKTFWINTYNAFTRLLLNQNPKVLEKALDRHQFFAKRQLFFNGFVLSLDDVEHGILRRSKNKWSKGYFGKLWVNAAERKLRVKELDARIHFALNCGAISCPPIRFYEVDKIEEQLEQAAASFLDAEVKLDERIQQLTISPLFNWYAGDFGGKKGIRNFIKRFRPDLALKKPSFSYSAYHWVPSS